MLFAVFLSIFSLSNSLSHDECTSHDDDSLNEIVSNIYQTVDDILVPSLFSKAAEGKFKVITDEEDGEESGGGTNTFGSYSTMIWSSDDVFADGICDIPGMSGDTRCFGLPRHQQTISFLLGPADVIALVTCTPPPMAYFAYDNIIDVRLTEEYPFYPGQNFGDTVNLLNVNTSATDGSNVFDEPILLLMSGDRAAAQRVADAYVSAGVALGENTASAISFLPIDVDTVRVWDKSEGDDWHNSKPDLLSHIARLAVPAANYEDAYAAFKNQSWPVKFYFADNSAVAEEPVRSPTLKDRYSPNVVDEVEVLGDSFERLKGAVNASMANANFTYHDTQKVDLQAEGFYDDWDVVLAAKNNDTFVAGTRDATYGVPVDVGDTSLIFPNTVAVAVGVRHNKVLNAAYSSFGIDAMDAAGGTLEAHWFVGSEVGGSAAKYIPEDEHVDDLFAVIVLPEGGCASSTTPQWCVELNHVTNMTTEQYVIYFVGERVYSVDDTHVGSFANATIGMELMMFKK